jgi:hypothetical protein
MQRVGGTHQQIEVVVDELPVLQGWQMWCKGAEHRAGVAGEIDDRERGHTAKAAATAAGTLVHARKLRGSR